MLGEGKLITSDEFKRKTYTRFLVEASRQARSHRYLILCGTFYRKIWRKEVKKIAEKNTTKSVFVRLRCSLHTCLRRNRERAERIEEKTVEIIHMEFEEGDEDLMIDTEKESVGSAAGKILKFIKRSESFP